MIVQKQVINQRARIPVQEYLLSYSHFIVFFSVTDELSTLVVARVITTSDKVKNPVGSSVAQKVDCI